MSLTVYVLRMRISQGSQCVRSNGPGPVCSVVKRSSNKNNGQNFLTPVAAVTTAPMVVTIPCPDMRKKFLACWMMKLNQTLLSHDSLALLSRFCLMTVSFFLLSCPIHIDVVSQHKFNKNFIKTFVLIHHKDTHIVFQFIKSV